MIDGQVVVRSHMAGVFVGRLASVVGVAVTLADARQVFRWRSGDGPKLTTLMELSKYGPGAGSVVTVARPLVLLTEVCEVLPADPGCVTACERLGAK